VADGIKPLYQEYQVDTNQRLEVLESKLRNTRSVLLALTVCILVVCVAAANGPFVALVCNSLEVKKQTGQTAIKLSENGDMEISGSLTVRGQPLDEYFKKVNDRIETVNRAPLGGKVSAEHISDPFEAGKDGTFLKITGMRSALVLVNYYVDSERNSMGTDLLLVGYQDPTYLNTKVTSSKIIRIGHYTFAAQGPKSVMSTSYDVGSVNDIKDQLMQLKVKVSLSGGGSHNIVAKSMVIALD
jgi:hypothetical protein